MLNWALGFFVIAIIAAIYGFTGIAGAVSDLARALFFVALSLLVVSALLHVFRRDAPR